MAADFKSHILSRDEKGFAGVPFKRLLLGGIVGGLSYTLCCLILPGFAVPVGGNRRAPDRRPDRATRRLAALDALVVDRARGIAFSRRLETHQFGGGIGADAQPPDRLGGIGRQYDLRRPRWCE